jgi:hypothetical protein
VRTSLPTVAVARVALIVLCLAAAVPAAGQDLDRDGVPDQLEQALLERFAPTLLLARGECDGAPASFVPFQSQPLVSAKNGTVYGQAFAVESGEGGARIELHFFHLWARDCGRLGHDLDAEHVSALVKAASPDAPPGAWVAELWYAAAHEGSACDASSGAPARALGAEASGPRVFVSKGKHASYFDRGQCKWGCGGDQCGDDRAIVARTVINIGERGAPLNGALWVHSARWPLASKLGSDFDPALRARLEAGDRVIPLMLRWRGPQAPVLAGDSALDGLGTASTHTKGALRTATNAVGRFFRRILP